MFFCHIRCSLVRTNQMQIFFVYIFIYGNACCRSRFSSLKIIFFFFIIPFCQNIYLVVSLHYLVLVLSSFYRHLQRFKFIICHSHVLQVSSSLNEKELSVSGRFLFPNYVDCQLHYFLIKQLFDHF